MKTIAIFTTTRSDFGIFIPFVRQIIDSVDFDYKLFVGGTHLSAKYGFTINEIKNIGFKISATFDYLKNVNTTKELVNETAEIITILSRIFDEESFEYVCVLGDRYELLPIIQVSILFRKPIIHIHGGEISQGAIDEQIRHMITKAAHIHFTSCEEYAQNIRNMGEENWRVFNTGALAVENMQAVLDSIDKIDLFNTLGLNPKKKTVIMTYHPVTLETFISPTEQIENVFKALGVFNGQVLVTSPNVDDGGDEILEAIQKRINNENIFYVESLGMKKYLGLLNFAEFVIGNSSSAIIEAPFYRIPTVNIGKRQQGRIRHDSVIDTDYSVEGIKKGITKAMDPEFRDQLVNMSYKFGDGRASVNMLEALWKIQAVPNILIKKLVSPC
ncbi:MAG: UDP-N-acetylglucosamine 2-epimerase (hydrolyzing) [Bacteroidales bacterium]|nr:UDP-N-acetylglucosamine 2-epimerase (hydrolyzing) [Bacteroidales bacterium]